MDDQVRNEEILAALNKEIRELLTVSELARWDDKDTRVMKTLLDLRKEIMELTNQESNSPEEAQLDELSKEVDSMSVIQITEYLKQKE